MDTMTVPNAPPRGLYGSDGLHEWLEDLHRTGRERVESSVLAHLLRQPEYRKAFLSACGIDWPAGTTANVRCEVPIEGGGVADLDVQWTHQGARRLLIEHKPWAPFTYAQPANYVRQLKVDEAAHAAFVLLVGDREKVDIARRRLLSSRVVPAPSGSSWSSIEEHLRADHRSRWMKYRPIHKVVGALSTVPGPALHRSLAHFWLSRQPLEPLAVPPEDKGRVESLFDRLRLSEQEYEVYEDKQRLGVYLRWRGAVRHTELVWFGVAPPVAKQLGVASGAIIVVRGGQLPVADAKALGDWAEAHTLSWQPVQAGTRVAEWAIALDESNALDLLDQLATRLAVKRRRAKK
jgi:hypothetical protein